MAPRTECTTCERKVQTASLPRVCSGCTHERETCRKCWHQWLKSQVASGAVDKISCIQCSNILVQSDIKKLATAPVYKAYEDAQLKLALSQDPDFRWCISPKCKSGQIHDGGDIFTCTSCRSKACVHCNVAWHEGEACEDFQNRSLVQPKDEEASAKALEKMAKLCPGCSRKIEKRDGCDHMRCTMCNHEFCWLCLADFQGIRTQGNACHKQDCKYHSNNIALAWPFNAH